jgi:hypothetical protein
MSEIVLRDVVEQYARHQWEPRILMLAASSTVAPDELKRAGIAGIETRSAAVSAIWFARRSVPGKESWEIRRLTGTPYALVVGIEDDMSDDERDAILLDAEERLAEITRRFLNIPSAGTGQA